MEGISVVIVEDEPLLAKSLHMTLEDKGYIVNAVEAEAKSALDSILSTKPDIVLLDIQLTGEETGIWLADQIKQKYKVPYIFMTSFTDKETIREAIKTMPYGYMVKPVEEDELDANIVLALERFKEEQDSDESQFVINDAIFLKDEHYYIKLKFDEILYVQASGNYIEIYEESRKHVLKTTLKNILKTLPEDQFFQCHRSFVVNIEKVDKIGSRNLFINNVEIPLVKENRETLLSKVQHFTK